MKSIYLRPAALPFGTFNEAWVFGLKFPTTGLISGSTNCGIAWRNPADHTQAFGDDDGFNFSGAFEYFSLNMDFIDSANTSDVGTEITASLYAVDSSGADLYLITTKGGVNQGVLNYNFAQIGQNPGPQTAYNGVRLQITKTGAGSLGIIVPATLYFFGSKST